MESSGEKIVEDMETSVPDLSFSGTPGARHDPKGARSWVLGIPAGNSRHYRLAQLDDYRGIPRNQFPWLPGSGFCLRARASSVSLSGTWGFGFWNDPFSMGFAAGSGRLRIPALPQAAWFFFASPPNYLSVCEGVPGCGNLAASYAVSRRHATLGFAGLPFLPWLAFAPLARQARKFVSKAVPHAAYSLDLDPTSWHSYRMRWEKSQVQFWVDGELVFSTPISPSGRLGFVLWIDNQYAAYTPEGRLGYGWLPTPVAAWIEIDQLSMGRF